MLTSPTPKDTLHEAVLINRTQLLTDLEISVAADTDRVEDAVEDVRRWSVLLSREAATGAA
ncbi:MAG: hypothetical protein ACRDOT_07935 [Aeromicrobium sp.]